MKKTIYTILLALLPLCVQAETWDEANEAYAAGNYYEAIAGYESILDETPSADVYYNLGNAYFKQKELAQAILAYERCLRINPSHADAQYNLKFAESQITDNIEDNTPFFLNQLALTIRNLLSESMWLLLSVGLFLVALINLLVFAMAQSSVQRKACFYSGIAALLFSLIALWSGLSLHHRDVVHNDAIITQGVVNAKAQPDRSGTDLFVLHEGTKVHITDKVGEWYEIHVGNNIGWIPQSALERI